LLVLLRHGDELHEVYPTGEYADLPGFCQVLRSTHEGRKRCLTCRSLMTFAARHRKLIEYTCHGGVSIIAATAGDELGDGVFPVVASYAFGTLDPEEGWRQSRDHADGLGVDMRRLRSAYRRLPRLTEYRKRVTRALVDITACVIGEMVERMSRGDRISPATTPTEGLRDIGPALEQWIEATLFVSHDHSPVKTGKPSGANMVALVVDMVSRNPDMPFTIAKLAGAARMTPNHFSAVFRRHTGKTFTEFLAEKRLALAKELLRDLTLDVGEVASRAGFRDKSYFARRFKRSTGMTPTQWRNSL
jgi:AraC-like DNA-binding protein